MKTIQLNIPDTVDLDDREAKMLLASRLYEKGKLTLGQAADLVGLSKRAFMELLSDYDVAWLSKKNLSLRSRRSREKQSLTSCLISWDCFVTSFLAKTIYYFLDNLRPPNLMTTS